MSRARLLVVEDEAAVAADLQKQRSDAGYEVVAWALSGEAAVELAGKTPVDLVLMEATRRNDGGDSLATRALTV